MSKFYIRKAANGQFYFVLKAGNNETILTGETYTTKQSCKDGIESVRRHSTDDSNYRNHVASNGQFYFTLVARNGEVIGTSETYATTWGRDNGQVSVKASAPKAEVVDQTPVSY